MNIFYNNKKIPNGLHTLKYIITPVEVNKVLRWIINVRALQALLSPHKETKQISMIKEILFMKHFRAKDLENWIEHYS